MSYGLRRYETIHRLWWFVFFILCLLLAWYSHSFNHAPRQGGLELSDLRKTDFWTGLQGIGLTSASSERSAGRQDRPGMAARLQSGKAASPGAKTPLSEASAGQDEFQENIELISATLFFLIRAGIIFLELRLLWLVVQYAGRYLLQIMMSESMDHKPAAAGTGPEPVFPVKALVDRIGRSPLSFFLHPFIRLRLMLPGYQKSVSSENLFEKERRLVEADWNILYGSWGPYRVLFWVLPLLGLAQTVLLLVAQFSVGLSSLASLSQKETFDAVKPVKEILDTVKPSLSLLLPLIQVAGVAVFFHLASSFLRYLEELYLSNLDSFIYDRLLSRLPLRSNDTILILEALQRQFRDLQAAFKRLESKVIAQTQTEVEKQ